MHTAVLERSIGHPIATTGGLSDAWRRFRRNRLAVLAFAYLVLVHAGAALAPWLGLHAPEAMDLLNQFASPSHEHLLGTDETGRDVLSRLVYGARTSLIIGLAAMVVAVAIGIVLGALSGFYGGLSETLIMRLTDGMLTVPTFFLALLVLAVFGSNIANVVLVIGLTGWMVVRTVGSRRGRYNGPGELAGLRLDASGGRPRPPTACRDRAHRRPLGGWQGPVRPPHLQASARARDLRRLRAGGRRRRALGVDHGPERGCHRH
jgi:N-terminal TM domain of oligopeptide transport permease C